MPRSQCEKENVQLVQELAEVDGPFESPINLNFRDLIKLELPPLAWNKPDAVPKKMKITNTGHTVIISGKWKSERPYLTGGPLDGKYVFSQIHFHWGPDNCKGSEHQVSGESFPLEMHVAHFKTEYMTQEAALREKDGMVVIVYLFKLQEEPNNSLKKIINALPSIRQTNTSQQMENRSILGLCNPFTDDYFMYWGSVVTSTCAHILLWIVCREPFGISRQQMEEFRKLLDSSQRPIQRNSREPQPLHKRNVFHVNASRYLDEPMRPIKQIMGCFCDRGAADPEGDDSRKSEGDGGCSCNSNCGPQEELEDRKDPDCNQQTGISRGDGIYTKQTVYYQHATVHSVSAMPRDFSYSHGDPELVDKKSISRDGHQVSQSCCFLSVEEQKSLREERRSRERPKDRRRKPIDSVTTLTNLIETLETLKVETYKKLKEIESINHEIRGMKSSCENLHEKNWLRHAEKIMSRQKRFTIRSSQCCFSELKKLAKECNFDKLLDDKLITGAEDGKAVFLNPAEATDGAFLYTNASGDKTEFIGRDNLSNRPHNFLNSERFSRKSQKLIRSFFEDIKESEETQVNLEKNLILKKFEKLSRRSSDQSNVSSVNIQSGQVHITQKMMNMGRIRNQFFTDIPSEEKIIPPSQTKLVPTGKKKKKKSRTFFKIRLGGFDNDKPTTSQKVQRSLFTRSALAWLNNRFSTINGNGPFISLRLRDIELRSGTPSSKKKSKQSLKSTTIKKVISDDHIRTEVSSYMSESFVSEISDKQSRYSKQSNTRVRNITHETEKNSESGRKSELSLMKFAKDIEAQTFFTQMKHSTNMSSGTSTDTERKTKKFRSRRSRKDLWEKGSSGMFRKEVIKEKNEKGEDTKGVSESEGKRASTSTDSSSTIRQRDQIVSCHSSKSALEIFKDVCVVETETQTVSSPRRKKLRLDGRSGSYYVEQDSDRSDTETTNIESCVISYTENECQADLNPKLRDGGEAAISIRNKSLASNGTTPKSSREKCDCSTDFDFLSVHEKDVESQTEQGPTEKTELQAVRDTPVEVNIPLPTLLEDTSMKDGELAKVTISDNEASEVSLSPRKSSDAMNESKDFLSDMHSKQEYWVSKFSKKESNPSRDLVIEEQTRDLVALDGLIKGEESSRTADAERTPQPDIMAESSETYVATNFLPEESTDRKKIQSDGTRQDSEFTNLFTAEEMDRIAEVSRDASQNELSEFNDYDLQTDSNGTLIYNAEKEMQSRESIPSIQSSDDEKQHDTAIVTALSAANIHSQQKPFSADSLNSFSNTCDGKRKRRQCIRNKSKQLVRKSNAMMKKLSKIGGSNLDFTNLTEEEQLKIISANVAKFVKQKLVEHKHFFDFGKSENIHFDIEQWSKSAELDLMDVTDEPEGEGKWKKEMEEKGELEQETTSQPTSPVVPMPASQSTPLPPPEEVTEESEHSKMLTVVESTALSPAGDTEKIDKNDLRRQTLDFVKLNKIMAGKYKRGTPHETPGTKSGGKKVVKKESPKTPNKKLDPNESPKAEISIPKPGTMKQVPGSLIGRGVRAPSVDSAKRVTNLQRGGKSDIPVLQNREPCRTARVTRVNGRSASASPTAATAAPRSIPSPTLALQKPKPPKKRLIPTYTLTSYLPAPSEVMEYQQRELDKYLIKTNKIADFFLDESKDKKYSGNKNQDLSQKNLDYLIMLQKKINHEISANIENSMNYVQTLLSQDYNGTAIIEKAPVKSSLDVFEPGIEGIVLIEMNDQFDGSSSSSEFSEESGFYCIYQGRNRREKNGNVKREIIVKRKESGDSGLVDSRLFEELNETDSSYSCEVSILVAPEGEKPSKTSDVSDVLKKYIYHLGGGEESESCYISNDALMPEEPIKPKPQLKKRRDRVLDLSKEMKRKLLDVLEDDVWGLPPQPPATPEKVSECVTEPEGKSTPDDTTKKEDELENAEMISKISDMVKLYLNEYDRTRGSDEPEDNEESPEARP